MAVTPIRVPIFLQQAVMHCLRENWTLANQRLKSNYPLPTINYHQRGTTAGSAYLNRWEVRLNATLLKENGHDFIEQVICHELAHLLVYRHFGRTLPHGKEWRWMMEEIFQQVPSTTHRFAVDTVQGTTFPYQCACQQHQLTLRRHNSVIHGKKEYYCRKCKQPLSPK